MPRRSHQQEEAAAQIVARVLGGDYQLHDTGSGSGLFDALVVTPDGRTVALEATSYGGDDWKRTSAGIRREPTSRRSRKNPPQHQWQVQVSSGTRIPDLQPGLNALLISLEERGQDSASSRYLGDDPTLRHAASVLENLGVRFVGRLHYEPAEDAERLILTQAKEWAGTAASLTHALEAVFEKTDNQAKLADADADERHLFVLIEDEAAAGRFQTSAPLPQCPHDPERVIDVLWVQSFFVPSRVFRTRPGSTEWASFDVGTGEQHTPSGAAAESQPTEASPDSAPASRSRS
jgi:hypothetical protein